MMNLLMTADHLSRSAPPRKYHPLSAKASSGAGDYSLFPIPYSLFPTPYSLFPIPCSLFPVPCPLLWLFKHPRLRHHHYDACLRDVISPLPVLFRVVPDLGVFGKLDVAVDDGTANARVAADVDVSEEYGAVDVRVTVHAHVRRQDGDDHVAPKFVCAQES